MSSYMKVSEELLQYMSIRKILESYVMGHTGTHGETPKKITIHPAAYSILVKEEPGLSGSTEFMGIPLVIEQGSYKIRIE